MLHTNLPQVCALRWWVGQMAQHHRKKSVVALKVDIRKAHDTVPWAFLRACLMKLGFSHMASEWSCYACPRLPIRLGLTATSPIDQIHIHKGIHSQPRAQNLLMETPSPNGFGMLPLIPSSAWNHCLLVYLWKMRNDHVFASAPIQPKSLNVRPCLPFFEQKLSNLLIVSGSPLQSDLPWAAIFIHHQLEDFASENQITAEVGTQVLPTYIPQIRWQTLRRS